MVLLLKEAPKVSQTTESLIEGSLLSRAFLKVAMRSFEVDFVIR